jgi:hypothetical protein
MMKHFATMKNQFQEIFGEMIHLRSMMLSSKSTQFNKKNEVGVWEYLCKTHRQCELLS